MISGIIVALGKPRKNNTARVYVRVRLHGEKLEIPTGVEIPIAQWDNKKRYVRSYGRDTVQAQLENAQIDAIVRNISEIITRYALRNEAINIHQLRNELDRPQERESLIGYAEQHIEAQRKHGEIRAGTHKNKVTTLNIVRDLFPKLKFQHLHANWAKDLDILLKKRGHTTNTRWKHHKEIKSWLNAATKAGINFIHPYGDHFRPRSISGKTAPLTNANLRKLINFYTDESTGIEKRILRAFLFACGSGLRISDLRYLRWSQVENNAITVIPQKTSDYGQVIFQARLTDLSELMYQHARATAKPGQKFIFDGFSEQYANKILKRIADLADVRQRLHWHCARSTFATLWLEAGGNETSLMAYMGIEKYETVRAYAKIRTERITQDIDLLNEKLPLENIILPHKKTNEQ